MPGDDGKLTTEDRSRVTAWLEKNSAKADMRCPVCGATEWMLAEHLVQPITLGPKMGLLLGGSSAYPQVMLISKCGYTMMINAVIIGLVS